MVSKWTDSWIPAGHRLEPQLPTVARQGAAGCSTAEGRGRGASTASQTAWALLALHAAEASPEAVGRGVAWLARTQQDDGDWDEPQFTGTGFPGDFYIRYHLYRLNFPVMALGRILRGAA